MGVILAEKRRLRRHREGHQVKTAIEVQLVRQRGSAPALRSTTAITIWPLGRHPSLGIGTWKFPNGEA